MSDDRSPEPCVILSFVPTDEDDMPVGASRFGGDPDLPHDMECRVSVDAAIVVDRKDFAVVHADVSRGALTRYEPGDPHTPKLGPVAAVQFRRGFSRTDDEQHAGYASGRGHRLLGVAWKGHETMANQCEWATSGDMDGRDWRLLLQLDGDSMTGAVTHNLLGASFLDMLYFWIRADDLAERRFENAWLVPLER